MSSFVVYEAVAVGFKEGFKIGIVWLVFYSCLVLNDTKNLIRPFYAGLFFAAAVSFFSLFLLQWVDVKEYLSNIISMSFALFLVSSAAALYHVSEVKLFRPFQGLEKNRAFMNAAVFLLTVLFFSPDSMGSTLYLKELSFMKDTRFMAYISGLTGFLPAIAIFLIIMRFFKPYWVGSFFSFPQLLLFLSIVKLLGGGIKGIAELSLIPSVQRGFMKFMHDFIHQTFVLIMVPDHPLLSKTTWNFIGMFFGPNIASVASLFILLFFPLMFIYYSLFKPLPEPEAQTGAERRKIKYLILSDRRKKALPVILFVSLIFVTWFSQGSESVSRLYNPKPKPVVEDKGLVMIPVNDPTMDLKDGALHKFSLNVQGEELRIIIIRKSNDVISVCLDACEICPPEGYGQREDQVVCIYCNTPIPVSTLGEPGGCNPIPLTASVDDRFVRIEVGEILKKWEYVKTGRSKEGIR